MKKKLKNIQMMTMVQQLQPLLSHRDKIGYFAARNYRTISEALTEYNLFRNDLIQKYSSEIIDDNGKPANGIKVGTPEFEAFCKELEPYNMIEHEVEIMVTKYKDAIGLLSGEEILGIDWMLED